MRFAVLQFSLRVVAPQGERAIQGADRLRVISRFDQLSAVIIPEARILRLQFGSAFERSQSFGVIAERRVNEPRPLPPEGSCGLRLQAWA